MGILRYPGGKWRLAPKIVRYLQAHDLYLEPFGGSAAVLLNKPPAQFEFYNDINNHLVEFFRVLRDCPDELARAVALTPWSRVEHDLAHDLDQPGLDPIERARRLVVLGNMSYGWRIGSRSGFRVPTRHHNTLVKWGRLPEEIATVAARLRNVVLECMDAFEFITRYSRPGGVLYVDPPYPREALADEDGRLYGDLSDIDHETLAKILHQVDGQVIVSGYDCPLYRELYRDWYRVEVNELDQAGAVRVETLWMNRPPLQPGLW